MHIQERGAERCLTSCMLCFRSFLNSNFCGPRRAQPGSVQPGNPNVMRELSFALPHLARQGWPNSRNAAWAYSSRLAKR